MLGYSVNLRYFSSIVNDAYYKCRFRFYNEAGTEVAFYMT